MLKPKNMRSYLELTAGLLRILIILALATPQLAGGQNRSLRPRQLSIPKVNFLYPPPYGTVFDWTRPQLLKTQITPEWIQETVRRRAGRRR